MPSKKRAPFVALTTLLQRRFPAVVDPAKEIALGRVLVDGAPVRNPAARVRADTPLRLLDENPLRGTRKLHGALRALGLDVCGVVALDLGAAAGGFTQALLDAGARRVYAVDAGTGQLRGRLRADPRVVNLERTNLAQLGPDLVPEPVGVVTIDLSYLALADALPQLDTGLLGPSAQVVALVKPTYELHAATLAADAGAVHQAVNAVLKTMTRLARSPIAVVPCALGGSRGAVEVFVHATVPGGATPDDPG